jgi:pimeloyl-ACP methyl ester carboxylesterase
LRLSAPLEREVELGAVRIPLLDWPGYAGPLLHVADPFAPDAALAATLAAALSPEYRVLSLVPRPDCPYQVQVDDLRGVLLQFGFESPVLISSGLGVAIVVPLAAWYPELVGTLVLIDPSYQAPDAKSVAARALRDCPPDWPRLTAQLRCELLALDSTQADLLAQLRTFLERGRIP